VRRRRALAAVGVVAAVLSIAGLLTGVLDRVESATVDARFSLRGSEPADDVAVVALDDADIAYYRRWPIRRTWHARAIDRLREAGVRQIAYDVQFTEAGPQGQEADDLALYDAVARAKGVVLATTTVRQDGDTDVLGGEANLGPAFARASNSLLPTEVGGQIRRVPYLVNGLSSFAVAAAESATGRNVPASGFGGDRGALIDFHGPPGTVPTYSFRDLVEGKIPTGKLRGRVVVVGASAPSLQDVHPVPTSGTGTMPGPEVQANAISTVLRGLPLHESPWWLDALAALMLAFVVPLAALRLRALIAAALGIAALALWLVVCQVAFDAGLVLAATPPIAGLIIGPVGTVSAAALLAAADRRRTRTIFGRFVPEPVVEELLAREGGEARLGGVRQDATVLFCDLRGFTTFAEDAAPELVIEVLNHYLEQVSDAVLAHGGTVVSYLGDGVMAVFGSPLARADHARTAVEAADDLLTVRLPRFHAWLAERGIPPFALGVGVNSGPVMSGLVGSERRMEYAAVGDTTNVAARLQAATKGTPHAVFIASSTHDRLGHDTREGLAAVTTVEVRGRGAAVAVYTLASAAGGERLAA
jgi:adenylate cyclase